MLTVVASRAFVSFHRADEVQRWADVHRYGVAKVVRIGIWRCISEVARMTTE